MKFPKSDGSLSRLTDEELRGSALSWAARLRRTASVYDLSFVPAPMTDHAMAVQGLFIADFADPALQIAAEIIERRGVGRIPDGLEQSEGDGKIGMIVIGRRKIVGPRPLKSVAIFLEFLARKLEG